ncbi:hypothetical protein GCM10023080_083930 [Streptomyces pseudoechinosporeus]
MTTRWTGHLHDRGGEIKVTFQWRCMDRGEGVAAGVVRSHRHVGVPLSEWAIGTIGVRWD